MINIDPIVIDLVLSTTAIIIMLALVIRVRNITTVTLQYPIKSKKMEIDLSLQELATLRLKRDGLRMIISRAYEEYSKGIIDEETKNRIVSEVSKQLSEIESKIKYLEKYEELNKLINERKKVEEEYKRKLEELDRKINSLKKIILPPKEKKEEKKVVKEVKEEKVSERRVKRAKKLTEIMEEIAKMLEESKE